MQNNLNLNVLQDFIDINGGIIKLRVKWYNGKIYIEQEEGIEGGVVSYTQMPVSATIEREIKDEILSNMTGIRQVSVNSSLKINQEVEQANKLSLNNKFKQAMDFEIELNSNRPAKLQVYTYIGVQRIEHDHTYVRALFTTNPYFATVFNGIRIVPYTRDIDELGNVVVATVKQYAKDILAKEANEEAELEFKVKKAFEITFYLEGQDVTKKIHQRMNKSKENQTTLDEFGFIAYIAYYQLFDGELNNRVALDQL